MMHLGGNAVYLDPRDTGIGIRESEADIAKVLSGMANCIAARTYKHTTIEEIAQNATIPVINALSNIEHPCQALTDLYTIWEERGNLKGSTLSYVGDGDNNVTHSLCLGATMLGMTFRCGSPNGYMMDNTIVERAKQFGEVIQTSSPEEAVKNADVVITDTWVSMGDKDENKRLSIFKKYQVNKSLMSSAKKDALFMHCLPAYRGKEVTGEIIDGKNSIVFQEAENRLHVQKALLIHLINE